MALIVTHPPSLITSACTELALSTPGEANLRLLRMQTLTAVLIYLSVSCPDPYVRPPNEGLVTFKGLLGCAESAGSDKMQVNNQITGSQFVVQFQGNFVMPCN